MKILLPIVLSGEFKKTTKSDEIAELEKKLNDNIFPLIYGNSIAEYAIHITCVHPKYDSFFLTKKPSYTEEKDVIVERIQVNIYKRFDIEIKLSFEDFYNSTTEEGLSLIASSIIETIRNLKYPTTIKDFDKDRFFNDLVIFFKQERLV